MKLKKYSKLIFVASLMFFALALPRVFAAQYNLEATDIALKPADLIEVRLTLSADNEDVNAVSGILSYDKNQLTFSEIKTAQSIVSFWVDQPKDTDKGVKFSGIIPGGYSQDGGYILSVVFSVKNIQAGSAGAVGIVSPEILLNDGYGTSAKVKINNYFYQITNEDRLPLTPTALEDSTPPEPFVPVVSKDENIFDNKWFLTFATQDKGSGIDHYEVKEGLFGRFKRAESPFLLEDQHLSSKITVRAVDKKGHIRDEVVAAKNIRLEYVKFSIYGIMLLLLILGLGYFGNKKFQKVRYKG